MTVNSFISSFRKQRPLYQELVDELTLLFREEASKREITYKLLESRVKEVDSLIEKIKRHNIKNPNDSIYDLVGFRVVCDFEDQIQSVRDIIRDLFVITWQDKKFENLGIDRMGYTGEHYTIKLPDNYKKEKQVRFSNLIKPVCEVQLKSSLNHTYDGITHQLIYKKEVIYDKETLRKINTMRVRLESIGQDIEQIRNINLRNKHILDYEEDRIKAGESPNILIQKRKNRWHGQ